MPPRLVAGHAHKTSSRRRGVSSIFFAPLLFILQVEAAVFPPLQSGRSRPTSSLKRLDPKVEAPLEAPGRSLLVRFYRLGSPPQTLQYGRARGGFPPPSPLILLIRPPHWRLIRGFEKTLVDKFSSDCEKKLSSAPDSVSPGIRPYLPRLPPPLDRTADALEAKLIGRQEHAMTHLAQDGSTPPMWVEREAEGVLLFSSSSLKYEERRRRSLGSILYLLRPPHIHMGGFFFSRDFEAGFRLRKATSKLIDKCLLPSTPPRPPSIHGSGMGWAIPSLRGLIQARSYLAQRRLRRLPSKHH